MAYIPARDTNAATRAGFCPKRRRLYFMQSRPFTGRDCGGKACRAKGALCANGSACEAANRGAGLSPAAHLASPIGAQGIVRYTVCRTPCAMLSAPCERAALHSAGKPSVTAAACAAVGTGGFHIGGRYCEENLPIPQI